MINESLKVHSKKQFEIKQKVSFNADASEINYQVETYFFLPTALQINPGAYSVNAFQCTLKNYVRLRPPTKKLTSINSHSGVLNKLNHQLMKLSKQNTISIDEYENQLKRYALTYKRSLRLTIKMVIKNVQKKTYAKTQKVLNEIEKSLANYRQLSTITAEIEQKIDSNAFEYCDEYISFITLFYLKKIALLFDDLTNQQIYRLLKQETNYHKTHYPMSGYEQDEEYEQILYRWSQLKKYVSSYLFLDIRRKKGSPILLHSIYGVAAALSMVFATIIAFLWQGQYGALSINLFWAMVIAYIFKDRMKEIGREQLFHIFQKWIPDRRLLIYKDRHTVVGTCKESFRFIKESELPKDIHQMREQSHAVKLKNGHKVEDILFYKKSVSLHNQSELFKQTRASIIDITRFNITDFLKYIDNMFEELPIWDEDEQLKLGEKVYHIYIIRRVINHNDVANELARLVINAEGIKRLDILQPLQHTKKKTDKTFSIED